MRKGDFVEASDPEFASQLERFAHTLESLATELDISAEELAEIKADAKAMHYAVARQKEGENLKKAWTKFKTSLRGGEQGKENVFPVFAVPEEIPALVPDGVEARFRKCAQRIKVHKKYKPSYGVQLGIVARATTAQPTYLAQPKIVDLGISGGKVYLKWRKGRYDGIHIYRRRGQEQTYVLVGTDLKPNWVDPTPLPTDPEVWTYKIVYLKDDQEVGQMSAEGQLMVVGLR